MQQYDTAVPQMSNLTIRLSALLLLIFSLQNTLAASELRISGKASMGGEHLNFSMILSESEMFLNQINGYQTMNTGYDGQSFWRLENGAGPFNIDFSEKEIWIIVHWMLSGYWLNEDAPITWSRDPDTDNAVFRLNEGRLMLLTTDTLANLKGETSDKPVPLPETIRVVNLPQDLIVRFLGQQNLAGKVLPEQIVIEGIGEVESFDITTASITEVDSSAAFRKPPLQLSNVSFNNAVSPELEIKQAKSGHIFVKPKINGEDVGWFLFDSGAGSSMLSQQLIDKFKLIRVAKTITGGIGGSIGFSDVYQGARLTLGPLTISNLNYKAYNTERSMASRVLGEPVVGVLGWDVLTRSVVMVDMLKAKMSIFNPDEFRIPAANRERLYLHWKVPYVMARFSPNHEGIFMLDTGAGNHGIFFPNFTVETLGLLEGNEGKQSNIQGAGGWVPIIKGTIDWFEIAGHKTLNVPVIFSIGEDHEADIFSTGFLGGAVVTPFKVFFDYRRNEVGFIKR